jgi:hypothetical protein
MDLPLLSSFIERLREESIGDPVWVTSKQVFEYSTQSVEVVAILKLVRAGQGVHALDLLCRNGLFVDMGAIYRCVGDCVDEVHFLLEKYPEQSGNVRKFVEAFFSTTIDGHLVTEKEPVSSKKIHAAMVRSITGKVQNEAIHKRLSNVYVTFSGYTHANYAHIMQMFGGPSQSKSFNISGIPDRQEIEANMRLVQAAYTSVLLAIAYTAQKLGQIELFHHVIQRC